MDRMNAAQTTATPRQSSRSVQSLATAFEGLLVDCDAAAPDAEESFDEDPAELLAALSQIGASDIADVLAATLSRPNQADAFKCFFCKDTGHAWLRCSKLWDHLKRNGFKARPRNKPFQRHYQHDTSKGNKQASATTAPQGTLQPPK